MGGRHIEWTYNTGTDLVDQFTWSGQFLYDSVPNHEDVDVEDRRRHACADCVRAELLSVYSPGSTTVSSNYTHCSTVYI